MVAVLGPVEALPRYIHTYIIMWRTQTSKQEHAVLYFLHPHLFMHIYVDKKYTAKKYWRYSQYGRLIFTTKRETTWLGYLVSQLLFDFVFHMHEEEKLTAWFECRVVIHVKPTAKFQRHFMNT
jgi:hypothetical protein